MSDHETEPQTDEPEVQLPDTPDEDGPADDDEAAEDDEAASDEDAPEETPPPEETPVARGISDEAREARFRKADRAVANYAKRIGEIYEEDAAALTLCPLCPDIHKGFVNVQDAGMVPDDVKNAVMLFLGYARERDYPQAPNVHGCATCAALGKVATGSKVAGKETMTCPECHGYGYAPPPGSPQAFTSDTNGHVEHEEFVATGAGVPDVDPTGEPRLLPDGRENPNYGKWPQYKIQVEPWGTTQGLTAQDAAV